MIDNRVLIALSIVLLLFIGSAVFAQSETDQPERRCPACNTLNRPDAKFCKNCGAALTPLPQKRVEQQTDSLQQDENGLSQSERNDRLPAGFKRDLNSLSREELIQLLQKIDKYQVSAGKAPSLPEGSIAYMTEDELRAMVTGIVKQELDQHRPQARSDPVGAFFKFIGAITLFILVIALIAAS
ncbi:MAG: zinc ribbon domain-containing protein [bacterium]